MPSPGGPDAPARTRSPRPGGVPHVTRQASVRFGAPILFRVIRVHGWDTDDGWAWLDGYQLSTAGDAVERRSIFVQLAGLLVLCLGLPHHLSDPAADALPGTLVSRVPAGSRLAVSPLVRDDQPAGVADTLTALYAATGQPLYPRTRRQVQALPRTAGLTGTAAGRRPRRRAGRGEFGLLAVDAPVVPTATRGRRR